MFIIWKVSLEQKKYIFLLSNEFTQSQLYLTQTGKIMQSFKKRIASGSGPIFLLHGAALVPLVKQGELI